MATATTERTATRNRTISPQQRPPLEVVLNRLSGPGVPGLPKYVRFQEALAEAIKAGELKPGDRLPTEKKLAEASRLSLGTVQRSLRNLVGQGLVVRQQGLASFVAETPKLVEHPWHCRFLDDTGTAVLPVYSKVLRRQLIAGRGAWNRYVGESQIFCIQRRLNIGNEFNVFARFYADRTVLPSFWKCSLRELNNASFKSLVARSHGLPVRALSQNLKPMRFDERICEQLLVRLGTVGVFLYAVAHTGKRFLYYQEFFIPPTSRFLHFSDTPEHDFFAT